MPTGGLDEVQFRYLAELLGELRAADNGMKERRVNGIHGVLHDLQPVARIEILLAGDESIAGPLEAIIQRERRLLVRRPHVPEHDPFVLMGWVGALAEPVFQRAVGWLARGLDDGSIHAEEPAVVAAPDAPLGDQSEFQRSPAVGTVQLEQSHVSPQIAEGHEVLAQDRHTQRQVAQIVGETNRLPEAAEVLAAWRSGTDVRELRVFLGNIPVMVAAKTRGQEGGAVRHRGSPSLV
jgi:hypothetical protein